MYSKLYSDYGEIKKELSVNIGDNSLNINNLPDMIIKLMLLVEKYSHLIKSNNKKQVVFVLLKDLIEEATDNEEKKQALYSRTELIFDTVIELALKISKKNIKFRPDKLLGFSFWIKKS